MTVTTPSARPAADECDSYYFTYIRKVPDGDVVARLEAQIQDSLDLLEPLDETRAGHRYEPGKWSVRDVVGHLVDTERIFAARALHFARRDPSPLPGMEQDDYVREAGAGDRPLKDLLAEWQAVRAATVALFRGLPGEVWSRSGIASGKEFTTGSLAWIIAGHELHHRGVLQERYLQVYSPSLSARPPAV
ncbi:MAG: DinB family protein [Gemmatimonadales bacterium]